MNRIPDLLKSLENEFERMKNDYTNTKLQNEEYEKTCKNSKKNNSLIFFFIYFSFFLIFFPILKFKKNNFVGREYLNDSKSMENIITDLKNKHEIAKQKYFFLFFIKINESKMKKFKLCGRNKYFA